MLKNCWECVMGSRVDNEVYGTVLNGFSNTAWPQTLRNNENMFRLPRPLNEGDNIHIRGEMQQNSERFFVNLLTGNNGPDYNNVVCQLEVNRYQDEFIIRSKENGETKTEQRSPTKPSGIYTGSNLYDFTIKTRNSNNNLLLSILCEDGNSFLCSTLSEYEIEDITFLTIEGDVTKIQELKFTYV